MTCGRGFAAVVTSLLGSVLLLTRWAGAVEHPGSLEKDSDCSSCHVQKMTGKSVHSAMSSPCMVCHVTMTQGDMTTVSLSMPKGKICFACHEEATAWKQHSPSVKGQCVECHDAHSSDRRMLLRAEGWAPLSAVKTK
jgi:predicted CXXCH cytochrome family protein